MIRLGKGQKAILSYLEENPNDSFMQKDIATALSKSEGTISSQIKRLRELNLITYIPPSGRTPAIIKYKKIPPSNRAL